MILIYAPWTQGVSSYIVSAIFFQNQLHIIGHARSLISDAHMQLPVIMLMPFFLIAAFITIMEVIKQQKSQVIYVHWVLPNGLVEHV